MLQNAAGFGLVE